MGRTIPSTTARLDAKLQEWKEFERALPSEGKSAYQSLMSTVRNYRAAIAEANEPDLAVPVLLSLIVQLMREIRGAQWTSLPGP